MKINHIVSLIRWPNLLMLAGIQAIVYYFLIERSQSVLNGIDFSILCTITVLIAAGGYVINDYYDHDMDKINKPGKWVAGNVMSLGSVFQFYILINAIGLVLSVFLAIRLDLLPYIFIFPIAVAGLWIYSKNLKCAPVIGNLWVSLFCAGVIMIVAVPDIILDNRIVVKRLLWFYIIFAFISTWIREIVKDIEDVEGDRATSCMTFVVRHGETPAKILATIFSILLIAGLLFWDSKQSDTLVKLNLTVIQGCLVGAMALMWWAKNKTYYHHASTLLKIMMVLGTLVIFFI